MEKFFKKIFSKISGYNQPQEMQGGSLGAALALWHIEQGNKRRINLNDAMNGSYLGGEYSQNEIEKELNNIGAIFQTYNYEDLIENTSEFISQEMAVGWFQGRMEFGPRALGARSILADPRSDKMQKNLNLKVKFRESFRPFAPSILREELSNWFEMDVDSPYMLLVAILMRTKKEYKCQKSKIIYLE